MIVLPTTGSSESSVSASEQKSRYLLYFTTSFQVLITQSDFVENLLEVTERINVTDPPDPLSTTYKEVAKRKSATIYGSGQQEGISTIETKNCKFLDSYGSFGVLYLISTAFTDTGSQWKGNWGDFMVFKLEAYSKITITNGTFEENRSIKESLAAVDSYCTVKMYNCSVAKNTSNVGSTIFFYGDAELVMEDTNFSENEAANGSVIGEFMSLSRSSRVVLKRCEIRKHTNAHLVLTAFNLGDFRLEEVDFLENSMQILKASLSQVSIVNSVFNGEEQDFNNVDSVNGGCLRLSESIVSVSNTQFQSCKAKNGGAIWSSETTLTMQQVIFGDNLAKSEGGALHQASFSRSTLSVGTFTNSKASKGADIFSASSTLEAENSTFTNYASKHASIFASSSSVDLSHCDFEQKSNRLLQTEFVATLTEKRAFSAVNCEKIDLQHTTFLNLSSEENGGAISVVQNKDSEKPTSLSITNGRFDGCTAAALGGAIFLQDVRVSIFDTSQWNGNRAQHGGAVYFDCSTTENNICGLTFKNAIVISNNSAANEGGGGGGIKWTSIEPTFTDAQMSFNGNTADFGPNVVGAKDSVYKVDSEATKEVFAPKFKPYGAIRGDENSSQWDNSANSSDSLVIYNQDSGAQVAGLAFRIVDKYGQSLKDDLNPTGTLAPAQVSEGTIKLSGQQVQAENGYFNFTAFSINAEPGSRARLELTVNPPIRADQVNNLEVTFVLNGCQAGQELKDNECLDCGKNSYSLVATTECKQCPSGKAICDGGNNIAAESGYWRLDQNSDIFLECSQKDNCPGGFDQDAICKEGHEGTLCNSCKPGYFLFGGTTCLRCLEDRGQIIATVGLLILSYMVILYFIVYKTIVNSTNEKKITPILIKILANHIQVIFLASAYELQWPDLLLQVLAVNNETASILSNGFYIDCLITANNRGTVTDRYFMKVVFSISVSLFYTFISPVIVFIYYLAKRYIYKEHMDREQLKNYCFGAILILGLLQHSMVTRQIFSLFSCRKLTDGGDQSYIQNSLDTPCWDDNHLFWVYLVGIPGLIFWVIGVPIVSLVLLIRNKMYFHSAGVKQKYGFLIKGYKSVTFYWEFMIVFRKLCLAALAIFLKSVNPSIQGQILLLMLFLAYYLQEKFLPFKDHRLNHIETMSITVSLIMDYCGLFFVLDNEVPSTVLFFLGAVVVGSFLYFLYKWSSLYFREMRKWFKSKRTQPGLLWRVCCFCMISKKYKVKKVKPKAESSNTLDNKVPIITTKKSEDDFGRDSVEMTDFDYTEGGDPEQSKLILGSPALTARTGKSKSTGESTKSSKSKGSNEVKLSPKQVTSGSSISISTFVSPRGERATAHGNKNLANNNSKAGTPGRFGGGSTFLTVNTQMARNGNGGETRSGANDTIHSEPSGEHNDESMMTHSARRFDSPIKSPKIDKRWRQANADLSRLNNASSRKGHDYSDDSDYNPVDDDSDVEEEEEKVPESLLRARFMAINRDQNRNTLEKPAILIQTAHGRKSKRHDSD